jgi:hypothetical protein
MRSEKRPEDAATVAGRGRSNVQSANVEHLTPVHGEILVRRLPATVPSHGSGSPSGNELD